MSQSTLPERPYLNSNLFSGHYLDERLEDREEWDCDAEAHEAMENLQTLYEHEQGLVEGYNEASLVQNWIDEVLDVLGFGTQTEVTLPDGSGHTDDLLFGDDATRREAAGTYLDTEDTRDLYERAVSIVEAKRWDADFTERFSEERPYRNASHQIKHYLERTPENIQWGILTNGRKWRLYGTKDYETETYYEVDLPELLASGSLREFKYFYLFFRPAAFRESAGTTFLDTVWSESETAARELGEDLQDNVFTALRVLGRGFVETNGLDVDPDDEEQLDELKNQSLVLLYRLMFVLYAEARGLIHPDDPDSQEEYDENFSLDRLRTGIHDVIGEVDIGFDDEYSEHSTAMWNRLDNLFDLIRAGEESLGIPPYDGGLFDEDDHEFLADNAVSDRYLAEVIYRLSTTENGEGRYVLADYADLDTRHLGSVYEGLLEHQFRIAPERYAAVSENDGQVWKPIGEATVADAVETVEEGGLYVVNDEGQRKATGAYFTPDYVVTYIVEETVGPLVDKIEADLKDGGFDPGTEEFVYELSDRVLDLSILDPAMGSGHFLTKTTGYLAERVMERVRELGSELGAVYDEQEFRRNVARECIYGVDLNEMAVELAKLSMWLETLAADQPLAFLDHHFKRGNSLVGSDPEAIKELESDGNDVEDQSSLAEFGATRHGTIDRLRDIHRELLAIDNETLDDIRAMKRKYAKIEQDEIRRRLVAMANVHSAEAFGLDLPGGAYERMARAVEDNEKWNQVEEERWFERAQSMAEDYAFHHWKLEFFEVFYEDGDPRGGEAGFDVVIGNPPYVRVQRIPEALTRYLFDQYDTCSERTDLSLAFLELSTRIVNRSGVAGFISTSQWLTTDYGRSARAYMSSGRVLKILDFGTLPVFQGISTYPAVFILTGGGQSSLEYGRVQSEAELDIDSLRRLDFKTIEYDRFGADQWVLYEQDFQELLFEREPVVELGELGHFHIGAITGCDDVFALSPEEADAKGLEQELLYEYAHRNSEITRYGDVNPGDVVIYPYEETRSGETRLLTEDVLKQEYPNVYEHLRSHEEVLRDRKDSRRYYARGEGWYQFLRPGSFEYVHPRKLLFRGLATRSCVGWLDEETVFSGNNCPGYVPDNGRFDDEYLVAMLNSDLISVYLTQISPAKQQGYTRFNATDLNGIPIREVKTDPETEEVEALLSRVTDWLDDDPESDLPRKAIEKASDDQLYGLTTRLVSEQRDRVNRRDELDVGLLDYVTTTPNGPTLTDVGFYQPPRDDPTNSELYRTAGDDGLADLKIGTVSVERPDETTAVINATARYKPDDEDDHDIDQYGYVETGPIEAFRLTDLSELEADLVEAFVPAAAEEAGGFADFRENATKTISLVDRLKGLTLPDPDTAENDLRNYLDAKARADELDEKIERTERLVDEIVYELYGLTDEEVEVVEEAVEQ